MKRPVTCACGSGELPKRRDRIAAIGERVMARHGRQYCTLTTHLPQTDRTKANEVRFGLIN